MKSIRWFIVLNVAGLLAASIWFRCRELGNLPGVNGDEAWYGVEAELVLHGEPIAWRTPTGNRLNPLFFGPQLLLHAIFEPSFTLLRITAVASGLLALALNFMLCRKVFGRQTAVVSTAILAVLPINIVYSRLAWDTSQSLLITLLAIYWSLRAIIAPAWRLWFSAAAMIALAVAIIVHPTNLFVAPVVAVCLLVAWRDALAIVWRNWKVPAVVAAAVIAILAARDYPRFEASLGRLVRPTEYSAFATNLGRLFSGETVYEYVSGAIAPAATGEWQTESATYDAAAALITGLLALGLFRWFASRKIYATDVAADDPVHQMRQRLAVKSLAVGWGLSLLAFYTVAGPAAIAPHFERYGICLVGPGAILAALGICGWLEGRPALKDIAALSALLVGWLLLLTVKTNLFDFIHRTGGESHLTFRTAAVEPKEQALKIILEHAGGRAEIRTTQWWLYWPLRYLSFGRANGAIDLRLTDDSVATSEFNDQSSVWRVEFTESPSARAFRQALDNETPNERQVRDFAGRPIISMFSGRNN